MLQEKGSKSSDEYNQTKEYRRFKILKKFTHLYMENDHKRPHLKSKLFTLYRHNIILKMFGVYLGPMTAFAS